MSDPNSLDQEFKDGQAPNPEIIDQGTEGETTPINPLENADSQVDYQRKFSESSKEALRLLEEKKALEAQNAEYARQLAEKGSQPENAGEITESLYPGFEELDPQAQDNLVKFTNSITKRAQEQILRDPAIAFARQNYNERKWERAFENVVSKRPELKTSKDEFKAKYFKASNVPDNIENILDDVSKIYLFDKAKDIGIREVQEQSKRVDLERTTGGDKTPQASRSLEDWSRLAQENPAKFASMSKEYHADLDAGKLKE
jgi:hypothetical protein